MSEKEIRSVLRRLCADLDRQTSRSRPASLGVGHVVLPLVLGAGLVAPACDGDVESSGEGGTAQTSTQTGVGLAQPAYGVPGGYGPWGGAGGEAGAGAEGGAGGGEGGVGGAGGAAGAAGDPGVDYMAPDPS